MSATDEVLGTGHEARSNVPPEGLLKKRRWLKVVAIVVMVVLGVLALLCLPFFVRILTSQRSPPYTIRVKSEMKDVQVAIGHYRTEYDSFPVGRSFLLKDAEVRSEGAFLAALIGNHVELNPKKIKFLDLPMARDGKNGLVLKNDNGRFLDRWGEMYYLTLDANMDNRIANPEARTGNLSATIPESINATVIIYSSGPDRDPNTWEDNVCSWR